MNALALRPASTADARRLAALHAERITEGFLPTLGSAFLERLYRRILLSEGGAAVVAEDASDHVVGFAAGTDDVAALYKRFLLRDGLVAALRSGPRLARSLPRVVETLRYPAAAESLPDAEILAVAVGAGATGQGLGTRLVLTLCRDLRERGVPAVKVVAAVENDAARRCYVAAGFSQHTVLRVHAGRESIAYVRDLTEGM